MDTNHGLIDDVVTFYRDWYREDIAKLAQLPSEHPSLWVSYSDLWRFDPDLADDLREHPGEIIPVMEEAVDMVDIPLEVDLSHVRVRVSGLNEEHVYSPNEIRKGHGERYVGIEGVLERVTSTSDLAELVAFNCERCGTITRVPQSVESSDLQEPHECVGCERQGPFRIASAKSEWSDYAKLRIESHPGSGEAESGKISGYVLNDLIDHGGENGLIGRAGEPATIYGMVKRVQKDGRNENGLLFDHVIDVRAIEFDRDNETVNIEEHRDTFTEIANQKDAVDIFADSIAPNLHATEAWDAAFEFAVAYLFGAPRLDIENGPTYRGDLHFLIISDYGMGKSDFSADIEAYSPKCISKSTTALSSDVGLTAAATKDDFGEGQWTIKPGLLVKANGGHLILDEIDKGPDELTNMNDALEGKQQVDVEKAGKSATYDSRTALLALGNPVDGRFDPNESISAQLGIKESLLSRFDGIVTMEDRSDVEQDRRVASTFGKAYTEAQQAQYGEREEFDVLDRRVPIDVGQAWIKYARENIQPVMTYSQFQELEEWYAEEVRQLNHTFATSGEGEDMPVPATVRKLGAAVKMSLAFARVHLREEVTSADIERAKKLGKKLIKQNWNGESFDVTKNASQQSRMDRLKEYIRTNSDVEKETVLENVRGDRAQMETDIDNLMQNGIILEPKTGVLRWA